LEEKYGLQAVITEGSELYELENNEIGIVSPTRTNNNYSVAILDNNYEVILNYDCEATSPLEAINSQKLTLMKYFKYRIHIYTTGLKKVGYPHQTVILNIVILMLMDINNIGTLFI